MKSRSTGPLLIHEDVGGPRQIPLEGTMLIGRSNTAEIRIEDRSLSGRHCRLEPVKGGWKIVDLESRNGTLVNDVLIQQRRLEHGDRIRLGRVQLRFLAQPGVSDVAEQVETLVATVADAHGSKGLLRAAEAFADSAGARGASGLLVNADEIRAARQLNKVMNAMLEEQKTDAVFESLIDALISFTGAERGFVILSSEEQRSSKRKKKASRKRAAAARARGVEGRRVVAARNFDREGVKDALDKISHTVERQARESGEPVIVSDAYLDTRFKGTDSIADLQLRSILCAPVRGRRGAVGTIYLDNRFERGVFHERQLPLVKMFADQAAIALRNAELHEENRRRLDELELAKSEVEELNRVLSERVAQTSAELMEVKEHVLRDRDAAPLKYSYSNIVGQSRSMRDVFHLLDKVTDSDVPVFVHGESGTGKELVARAIHFNGSRKGRPFISENCAAIPETLLESELFGYKKGAFTGATADKKGLFEAANGGTLFLDEIGDMAMSMQKKLLRVLQEQEVRPVGGKRAVKIDVRILAASNQDLRKLCDEGRFREDLYYRINVITVNLPPLRDRREDVPLLVDCFLDDIAQETGDERKSISDDALAKLMQHHWPGNVRELKNEIQRAAALSDRVIVPLVLSPHVQGRPEEVSAVSELGEKSLKEMVREVTDELESRVIQEALNRCRGRKAKAARLLGVSRPTLDAKIELYGLVVKRE